MHVYDCVYACAFVYIYLYVCLNIHIYMYMISLHVHLCIYLTDVFMCICMYVYVHLIFFQFMLVMNCVSITRPSYGDYEYPGWAEALGWTVSFISVIPIPAMAVYELTKTSGTMRQVCSNNLQSYYVGIYIIIEPLFLSVLTRLYYTTVMPLSGCGVSVLSHIRLVEGLQNVTCCVLSTS